ncbi:hypothetical protein BS47DRAFT_1331446 [Hydnum rufescens UP504]|uniref:Histidine biosynthesis trifunctional protein n=1 Tax=Hydnum rufescens UP504 TaxID=1448309 RepID=A0A9P6DTP2_9AGAM|nr:hypothetical protein BS47DRAFT_1331446 [Hydnum rufescens UP504]
MYSFLSLQDTLGDELLAAVGRIGPIIVPEATAPEDFPSTSYYILAETPPKIDAVISWLNNGADRVILPLRSIKECIELIPKEKLILLLDSVTLSAITETIRSGVSGIMLQTTRANSEFLSPLKKFFSGLDIFVHSSAAEPPAPAAVRELCKNSATIVIPTSQLTLSASTETALSVGDAFLAPMDSDRPDGLFPTIVSSYNQGGKSLGLVYSSAESVRETIITGRGVYQSRGRGLWRKGETSGATQTVVSIRADCDQDALEISVIQHGSGFCHLGTASCFGELRGLAALEATLLSRKETAVPGSYTRRLFKEPELLAAKIREEAEELIEAKSREEVKFEAADLLYFALTYCIARDVGLADIERVLDEKAKKVTRRPGNAKSQFLTPLTSRIVSASKPSSGESPSSTRPSVDPSVPISMRSFVLNQLDSNQRIQLLRRPVLKSDEMIAKVKPIVDDVRHRGDAALIELTNKFDKAQLSSTIVRPPYAPDSMALPLDVKDAIDLAYRNIRLFHDAQATKVPMVVETMPGVVCSRFSRPIARVGLYVPGGTAILPSTALMLGIPAQVAGCKEIVLATPPRPDGSISPEVMYVAHLVGASAILTAGGAQAVAALAYGTETVPKVDKIFGPGNQWVTAAKMMVQNDTDALVSIDMPAGPSEVLVITDSTGNPRFIAADLLSQAEHGVDSQVVLIAVNITDEHLSAIKHEIDVQARALPRVDIIRESIAKSIIVSTNSLEQAIEFSNDYAPEHLILHLENAPDVVNKIDNAGSVFVGGFTPESCGDYASGTNHTLPTNGYARQFSGVNTQSFQKHITSQEISQAGLTALGPAVITLAECEGLSAHANAVRVRLEG